jgi:LmbE family N-acetylglucosaminyl deacetylase
MNILWIEVAGHSVAVVTFAAIAMYGYVFRNHLRRNVRSSRVLYRLILATGVVFAIIHLARLYVLTASGPLPGALAWLDVAAEYPSVIAQSCIILYLLANKIIIERTGRARRVLIIASHPGELELAAGATLAKMHDAGYALHALILSPGTSEDPPPQGMEKGSTEFLGINRVQYGGFQENCFKDHLPEVNQVIHAAIQEIGPEIILTASCHDLNPDRQTVYAATLQAGNGQNAILCYESHTPGRDFSPTLYVDTAEYVEIKTTALLACRDERLQPAAHPEQVRARMAFRGLQAKVTYAEGFEVVRLLSSCLADL